MREVLKVFAENPLAIFCLMMILCFGLVKLATWKRK